MTTLTDKINEMNTLIAGLQAKIATLRELIKEQDIQYLLLSEKIPSNVMKALDGEVVHADEIQLPHDVITKTITTEEVSNIIKLTYNVTF